MDEERRRQMEKEKRDRKEERNTEKLGDKGSVMSKERACNTRKVEVK